MRSRSPVCCHLPSPLIMIYILLYTYTPAIDLVLIAYLDSMTMTSFNIFKARVVIFKKLKVNAKMQIEHGCWLWVVLLVIFIVFLYYRSLDAKSWWQNQWFHKNWFPKFEQFDWLSLILKLLNFAITQSKCLLIGKLVFYEIN